MDHRLKQIAYKHERVMYYDGLLLHHSLLMVYFKLNIIFYI